MNRIRKRNGLTLVELIVAMSLVGIIASASLTILLFGSRTLKESSDEASFQAATRLVLYETSEIIRHASAVFTIPKSSFRADNLSDGWDYIGIREVVLTPAQDGNPAVKGYEIVKYLYDSVTKTHSSSILLPAQADAVFEFVFDKVNPQNVDSLLQFTIKNFPAGSLDEYGQPRAQLSISSEVDALNSLQVIELSSAIDPAWAIAFSLQDRSKSVVGHVAMVLDKSGSMAKNLNGGDSGSSRISILKTEATTLINSFAQEDNIDIGLVPFATSANPDPDSKWDPRNYYNAKTQTASLRNVINNLFALGGTNTGDGLRRAYWGLKTHNAEVPSDVTAKNYVIILVDGVTTFASVISRTNRNYVMDGSSVNEGYLDREGENRPDGQIAGNGSELDAVGTEYVNRIGALLAANSFAKVYVIGFSAIQTELNSVNDIARACGASSDRVFRAGNQAGLQQVFNTIREDIVNDLWYLQGPDL